MYAKSILLLAFSAAVSVNAHGNVQVVTGDQGGNGTALGINGASVARFGANADTESDTTVFGGNAKNPMKDGLGETTTSGNLKVADLAATMAQAGPTLPQVSGDGTGVITGTWRIVTSDGTANGADGTLFAVIDPTGTGAYSQGIQATVESDMVGKKGNVVQRATNVGADAPFSVKIPAGVTCTGSDATSGQTNFCLMKIANNNNAGPFGGNVAFQIAGAADKAARDVTTNSKAKSNCKRHHAGKAACKREFKA